MGLPFAPNSVPLGMNPGSRRLTTRIQHFLNITTEVMVVSPNDKRICSLLSPDWSVGNFPEITFEPDIATSWHISNALAGQGVVIYGSMAIYARNPLVPGTNFASIVVYEYVYE